MTEIPPKIVVRRDMLGKLILDSDKKRELWDDFERDLGLDDKLYPITDPPIIARAMKVKGTVTKDV